MSRARETELSEQNGSRATRQGQASGPAQLLILWEKWRCGSQLTVTGIT